MNEFDEKAQAWDAKPIRVERAQAAAKGIAASVTLDVRMRALEYGCGTGLVSFALQPQLGHITLADSSPGMLAVLRDKIAAANIQNTCTAHDRPRHSAGMTPLQLDLMIDPPPAERYQLIYTLLTLHHIPDTGRILRAFFQLLDAPGYLCVADLDAEDGSFHEEPFDGHLGFDRGALGALAEEIGFHNIRFSTVFHMIKEVQGLNRDFPIFLMVAEKLS